MSLQTTMYGCFFEDFSLIGEIEEFSKLASSNYHLSYNFLCCLNESPFAQV